MRQHCHICDLEAKYFIDLPYGECVYLCEDCGSALNNATSINDTMQGESTLLEALGLELGEYYENKHPQWCHDCQYIASKQCEECSETPPTHYKEQKENQQHV